MFFISSYHSYREHIFLTLLAEILKAKTMLQLVNFRVNHNQTRILIFSGRIVPLPSRYFYYLTTVKEVNHKSIKPLCLSLIKFLKRITIKFNISSIQELENSFLNLSYNDIKGLLKNDAKLTLAVHGFLQYCRKEEKILFKFNEDDLLTSRNKSI
jgi:hypothetical protein